MDFEDIIRSTLFDFQQFLDAKQLNLQINALSDCDFFQLELGYSQLNWEYIIAHYYCPDDSFDFKFSWKGTNGILGAFISRYKINEQSLEIYAIENFERQHFHQMLLLSLSAVYLLLNKVGGKWIKLIDIEPNNLDLQNHYREFGFYPDPTNSNNFIQTLEQLAQLI